MERTELRGIWSAAVLWNQVPLMKVWRKRPTNLCLIGIRRLGAPWQMWWFVCGWNGIEERKLDGKERTQEVRPSKDNWRGFKYQIQMRFLALDYTSGVFLVVNPAHLGPEFQWEHLWSRYDLSMNTLLKGNLGCLVSGSHFPNPCPCWRCVWQDQSGSKVSLTLITHFLPSWFIIIDFSLSSARRNSLEAIYLQGTAKQLCCTPHSPALAGLHTPEHLHISSGYHAPTSNASNVTENITNPALCLGRISIKISTGSTSKLHPDTLKILERKPLPFIRRNVSKTARA